MENISISLEQDAAFCWGTKDRLSFVKIDQNTGLMTKDSDGILEPFIVGTEPYNNSIIKLDSLSSINNNSISGTGSLLIQ